MRRNGASTSCAKCCHAPRLCVSHVYMPHHALTCSVGDMRSHIQPSHDHLSLHGCLIVSRNPSAMLGSVASTRAFARVAAPAAATGTSSFTPDGRECRLCHVRDTESDPIDKSQYHAWGYPTKGGRNVGKVCFYCMRCYTARYEPRGLSVQRLEELISSDTCEHDKFFQLRTCAINQFIERGTHRIKLNWTAIDATVSLTETARVQVEEATDTYKPYADYVRQYGAPESNGLGHKRTVFRGHDVVVIPGESGWKVKRLTLQDVSMKRVVADASMTITDGELSEQFNGYSGTMFASLMPASGVPLNVLLGRDADVQPPPPSTTGASTSSKSVAHDEDDALRVGTRPSWSVPDATPASSCASTTPVPPTASDPAHARLACVGWSSF